MRKFVFMTFIGLILAAPAQANSGDMFDDEGLTVQNRPSVPSDEYYGYTGRDRDMFPLSQPYMRTDKDMFDFMEPPADPNLENHFSAHIRGAPASSLFHNPNERP